MTIVTYKKAENIHNTSDDYRKLRRISNCAYKRHILAKRFLYLSTYKEDEVVLCDDELAKLIIEYCDEKIAELEKELDAL